MDVYEAIAAHLIELAEEVKSPEQAIRFLTWDEYRQFIVDDLISSGHKVIGNFARLKDGKWFRHGVSVEPFYLEKLDPKRLP